MASRLEQKLLDAGVDVIVGPDSYTHLPSLLSEAFVSFTITYHIEWKTGLTYGLVYHRYVQWRGD